MVALEIDLNDYPMLKSFKKKDLDKIIVELFQLGYKLTFPPKDETQNTNELKEMAVQIDQLKNFGGYCSKTVHFSEQKSVEFRYLLIF